MSIDLAGQLVLSTLSTFFFQRSAYVSDIFGRDFCYTPSLSHHNHRILEFDTAMSKFLKMFYEDSISQIRGSCDACDEEGGDKNCDQKNQTDISYFFGSIFITHRGSCDDCDWGWGGGKERVGGCVMKIATKKIKPTFSIFWLWFSSPSFLDQQFWEFKILKNVGRRHNIANLRILQLRWGKLGVENCVWKIKNVSLIFSAAIFVAQFSTSQSQDSQIRYIVSSSNIFENLKFSKMFVRDTISRIRGSCDCDWRGWMTKIAAEKNQRLRSWLVAFLWCLLPFSRTGWRSRSVGLVRCDNAARLIIHTWAFKLLNQATRPSCSTDLAGWLAV